MTAMPEQFDTSIERTFDEMGRACRSLLSRARALTKMTGEAGIQNPYHSKARSAAHFLESALTSLQPSAGLRLNEGRASATASMVLTVADHLIDGLAAREPSEMDLYKSGAKAAFEGQAPAIPIPELLGFLATYKKTGVLEITSLTETVVMGLRDGAVIHASSDNTPAGMRLGEILLARKAIEERALYSVLAKARSMRNLKVGELLEREGKVPKEELRIALELQIQNLFNRLFSIQDARFAFYERESSKVEGLLSLNVTHLLLGSAAQADERQATPTTGDTTADAA